jgi:hypothetical protein
MTTLMTLSSLVKALSKLTPKICEWYPFTEMRNFFSHQQNCLAYNKARVNSHSCEKHYCIATRKNVNINDTVKAY